MEIDLSKEFNPCPKTYKTKKMPKPINKIGKKGKLNLESAKELREDAIKNDRFYCEIKLSGCWKIWMGAAHGKKKRKLTLEELKKFAIGACNPCHHKIEYECEKWTGMSMEQFVRYVIKNRKGDAK